ncbi:MAG: penicillin-binding protein 2 [Planctomycetes bacterium]|nr:penicillin-binding protein 2 [Planctomycetota bacterium]
MIPETSRIPTTTNAAAAPKRIFANAYIPFAVLGLLLAVLAGKLIWVQFIKEKELSRDVDAILEKHLKLAPPRGRILDSQSVVLAGVRGTVNLVADGKELRKIEERRVAQKIPSKMQTPPPDVVEERRAEIIKMRGELIMDLARALDSTIGAPVVLGKSAGDDARATDIATRLGRLHKSAKGDYEPSTYVPIARKISPEEEDRVRAALRKHNVSAAFALEEDYERTYPAGAAVASIVGFYGAREQSAKSQQKAADAAASKPAEKKHSAADEPDRIGQGGVEQYYEEKLRGVAGSTVIQRAPTVDGGFLDLDRDIPVVPGADIQLTIDTKISSILQEEALAAFAQFPCDAVAGVVLDAFTGQVLAMAAVPGFDPNAAANIKNHPLNSFATGFSYEPGSSIKPFTVAAALEAGSISPDEKFDVNFPGGWQIPKRAKPIRDSHAYNGALDVAEILTRSSNIGAVKIGQKAGSEVIADAFERFGFHNKTGVELPVEGRIQLPRHARASEWDVANTLSSVSFGYQFYTTALRLAAGYSILANGGMRVEPRLVRSIRYPDGHVETPVAPAPRRVLSDSTCEIVREMLTNVITNEHGTGHAAAQTLIKGGYPEVEDFAGKTGTAVIHKDPSKMNGTFAVFGPMPQPRIVVVFVVFNSSARFGGTQCALPAMRALARTLRALGLIEQAPRALDLQTPGPPPVVPYAKFAAVAGKNGKNIYSEPRPVDPASEPTKVNKRRDAGKTNEFNPINSTKQTNSSDSLKKDRRKT